MMCVLLIFNLLPASAFAGEEGTEYPAAEVYVNGTLLQSYNTIGAAIDAANAVSDSTQENPVVVRLCADCETDISLSISSGRYVTLDLNDKVLKYTGSGASVIISSGNLTITDSAAAGTHYFTYVRNGAWTLYDGTPGENVIPLEDFAVSMVSGGEETCYIAVSGGVITGGNGEAAVMVSGSLTMTGGSVIGNRSTEGGVYVAESGSVTLGGSARIVGNALSDGTAGCNLYLLRDEAVSISGDIAPDGMKVGVTFGTGEGTGIITGGDHADCFFSDREAYAVIYSSASGSTIINTPVARLTGTVDGKSVTRYYLSVHAAIEAAPDNTKTTVTMLDDSRENISVPADKAVTLDLNGHILTGSGSGSVITVNGSLTVTDSGTTIRYWTADSTGLWVPSTEKTAITTVGGVITGGTGIVHEAAYSRGRVGGGVLVEANGSFTLTGGTIAGNAVDYDGGGVFVVQNGVFAMDGGVIAGNTAFYNGGGVNNKGTMTMTAGSITENACICGKSDYANGGGVYEGYNGVFTMTGGEITGNRCPSGSNGGGVYVDNASPIDKFITLGGTARITGNTAGGVSSNVYLEAPTDDTCDTYIAVSRETVPAGGMSVGVTMQRTPAAGAPVTVTGANSADYSSCFTSDNSSYFIDDDSSTVKLYVSVAEITAGGVTTQYETLQDAIEAAGTTPVTINMVRDSEEKGTTLAENQNITLNLDKYTLTVTEGLAAADGNAVLTIQGSGTIDGGVYATYINGGRFTGNVNTRVITDGYFLDADGVTVRETGGISGGCYAVAPEASDINPSYYIIENTGEDQSACPYTVVVRPAVLKSEVESPTAEQAEVITEILRSTRVSEASATNVQSVVKDSADSSRQSQLRIVLKSLEADAEAAKTTVTIVYDAAPVFVDTNAAGVTTETMVSSEELTDMLAAADESAITFCLPVPESMTGDTVLVQHGPDSWTAEVQGSGGERYVNVAAGSFSEFTLSRLTEENSVAKIERTADSVTRTFCYKALSEAFAAAADGETIVLLASVTDTAAPEGSRALSLDLNGKILTGADGIAIDAAGTGTLTIVDGSTDKSGKLLGAIRQEHNNVVIREAILDEEPDSEWIADTSRVTDNGDGTWTVSEDEDENIVAMVGTAKYTRLQTAVTAARNGGTVVLLKNAAAAITVNSDYNVILDLNGHTLSGSKPVLNKGMLTIVDSSAALDGGICTYAGGITGTVYAISTTSGTTCICSGNIAGEVVKFETGRYSIRGGLFTGGIDAADCAAGFSPYQFTTGPYTGKWTAMADSCDITVTSGTKEQPAVTVAMVSGGGRITGGSEVTVTAPASDGYLFAGWYSCTRNEAGAVTAVGEDMLSGASSYTFSVSADTDLIAVYSVDTNAAVKLSVSASDYIITIGGVSSTMTDSILNRELPAGTEVTVQYIGPDNFQYWADGNGAIAAKGTEYTFTIVRDTVLCACTSSGAAGGAMVMFTNGEGRLLSARYYADAEESVQFPAAVPDCAGFLFSGWKLTDCTDENRPTIDATQENITKQYAAANLVVVFPQWENNSSAEAVMEYDGAGS